jgi:hypothetical protein
LADTLMPGRTEHVRVNTVVIAILLKPFEDRSSCVLDISAASPELMEEQPRQNMVVVHHERPGFSHRLKSLRQQIAERDFTEESPNLHKLSI